MMDEWVYMFFSEEKNLLQVWEGGFMFSIHFWESDMFILSTEWCLFLGGSLPNSLATFLSNCMAEIGFLTLWKIGPLNPLTNIESTKVYLVVSKLRLNSKHSNMKASFLQEQFFGAKHQSLWRCERYLTTYDIYDQIIFKFLLEVCCTSPETLVGRPGSAFIFDPWKRGKSAFSNVEAAFTPARHLQKKSAALREVEVKGALVGKNCWIDSFAPIIFPFGQAKYCI